MVTRRRHSPRPRRSGWVTAGFLVVNALAGGCRGPAPEPPPVPGSCQRRPAPPFVVGANVIDRADDNDDDPTNDGARGYGSRASAAVLGRLADLGMTGVVLPVEVTMASLTSTAVRPSSLATPQGLERLGAMIDEAHRRELLVVVVPHLRIDDGSWRGHLHFEGAARDAFFKSYREVLLPIAERADAHCAEVLSFALELKGMSKAPGHDDAFRGLIAETRQVFRGGLTYSANWDEAKDVRFWPLLDGVAINAFHPLSNDPRADDSALQRGALDVHRDILALKERTGQPVWLLEVGFKATPSSWVEPWLWPAEVNAEALPFDEEAQARAYRAVRKALDAVPAVSGVFFWMVPSDLDDARHPAAFEPRQGFGFLGKAAEREVRALAASPPRTPHP